MIKYTNIKQIGESENHLTKIDQAKMNTMVDESYGGANKGKNKGKKHFNDTFSRYIPHTANETKISGEYQFLTTGFNGFCEGKSFNSGSDGAFSPQNKLFHSRPVEQRNLLSVEENDKESPKKIINSEMDGYKQHSGKKSKKLIAQ